MDNDDTIPHLRIVSGYRISGPSQPDSYWHRPPREHVHMRLGDLRTAPIRVVRSPIPDRTCTQQRRTAAAWEFRHHRRRRTIEVPVWLAIARAVALVAGACIGAAVVARLVVVL